MRPQPLSSPVYHDTVVSTGNKMDSLLSVLTVSIVVCEEDKGNIATLVWVVLYEKRT